MLLRESRAVLAVAGAACLGLGALVVGRPFASLTLLVVTVAAALATLGVRELLLEPRTRASILLTSCWFALAGAVLLAPTLGFRLLVLGLGVWLVVEGALGVARARTRPAGQRAAPVLFGLSSTVLGVLALRWPDVTLVVAALAFGIRVLWLGLRLLSHAIRGPGPARATTRRRRGRLALAALSLLTALGLAGVSHSLHAASPAPDDFYAAPADVPAEPGHLLRAEPFSRAVPAGSHGWRILYTTTRDEGVPAIASGLVVLPDDASPAGVPVIAWAHGTTGVAEGCAPSLLGDPFEAGAMPALAEALDAGWAVVATDYVGLGTAGPHPYLIGQGEARSVLDAVRAAHQLDGADLADRTVVWGHSQGGHAALWTGIVAPSYAPDAGVVAVAALAPASNLTALVPALDDVTGGTILASFVVASYSAAYDDVRTRELVRPGARIPVEEMGERCLAERSVVVSLVQSLLFDQPIYATDPAAGATGARLAENVPDASIDAPLLIAQGTADTLISEASQAAYVDQRCRLGDDVDYRTYPGLGHLDLVAGDSPLVPDLVAWTQARFEERPLPGGPVC